MNTREAAKRARLDILCRLPPETPRAQWTELLRLATRDFHTIPKRPDHQDAVRFLIERGAVPDRRMVYEAVCGGHAQIARALASAGLETDPFVTAALGDQATVERLLAADPGASLQVDADGMTPLHFCCASGLGKVDVAIEHDLAGIAERLLASGASPNTRARYGALGGVTPLVQVCWTGGNHRVFDVLRYWGANVEHLALWAALGHFQRHGDGHYALAERLLADGLDVDHNDGRTLLHAFSAHEDRRGVQWLLDHGADVSSRTRDGATPLHLAAARNIGVQVIVRLLDHGASTEAVDSLGRTPLDLARAHGRCKAEALLRNQPFRGLPTPRTGPCAAPACRILPDRKETLAATTFSESEAQPMPQANGDRITIGTWQGPVVENGFEANLAKVESVLEETCTQGLDFLCFPETYLSGYTPAAIRESAVSLDDPRIRAFIERSRRYDTVILVGMSEKKVGAIYNTQLVVFRGALLGAYHKTMPTGFDRHHFTTDRQLPVFEAKGIKFGVVTCHSTSFVEPAQLLRWRGARLLFTPHFNRIKPEGFRSGGCQVTFWEHRTKVLNNQAALATLLNMVVVRSNITGVHPDGLSSGDSGIWNMNGELVATGTPFVECVVTAGFERRLFLEEYWINLQEVPAELCRAIAEAAEVYPRGSGDT